MDTTPAKANRPVTDAPSATPNGTLFSPPRIEQPHTSPNSPRVMTNTQKGGKRRRYSRRRGRKHRNTRRRKH